uniref:Methionyl-tRNA formyltransferase n=1 Tax=Candidatus Kentrum sp. FM TaxID=2126340 RepID=A0A450TUP1_9GAMM|nr:MAG: methionyl-tRNA formyltransferase [Candidatus Kentron sp. FM]VFJ74128.1 MAG: methionyl-tRNA formyltransferase [Candidatus Kentron sp. FM]VFK20232.1 MAG: methionyl-tRNA formyltransferase [Candidatus Kentron sp. FM]
MRIVFAGTPDFAAVILDALLQEAHSQEARSMSAWSVTAVYTQPDRRAGRGRKLAPSPVKRLAASHAIPIHQPETCRDETVRETLAELKPDVLVVAAYGLLLPRQILAIPAHGGINVHASLLPCWRGAAPIQRAILAGDEKTGVSIMRMDEGLDTGAVVRTGTCPIHAEDTAGALHDRLAALGAEQLIHALRDIQAGTARAVPQDNALATYAARLTKSEGELDWNDTAVALERKVRAFVPWPVAYASFQGAFQGERLRVWESTVVEPGEDNTSAPGTILACHPAGIDVATSEGALRLLTVQRPGAKPVSAADFLNGYRTISA